MSGAPSTPGNITPCTYDSYNGTNIEKVRVTFGQVLNITFGGSPPYNVSKTIKHKSDNVVYCGIEFITNYTSSQYTWTVSPINDTKPKDNQTYELAVLGDEVVMEAVAIGQPRPDMTPEKNGAYEYTYYASKQFVISNSTSGATSAMGPKKAPTLQVFLMISALILPAVLSSL